MGRQDDQDSQMLRAVRVKFASHFRDKVGISETQLQFRGEDLRAFIDHLIQEYDIGDLLLEAGEIRPHVRVVINGRYSSLLGGWEAEIPEHATIVLLHSYVIAF